MISHFPKLPKTKIKTKKKKIKYTIFDMRKLVYKKGIYIQNEAFLVEIYKYPEDIRILAINAVTDDTYRLIINNKEIYLYEIHENWDMILKKLDFEGDSLLLAL